MERRTHRRTQVQRHVEIEPVGKGRRSRWFFSGPQQPDRIYGKLIDIGCGGLCTTVDTTLPVGTPCFIRIEDPEGTVQRTRGIVRNVRPSDENVVGISFNEPIVALGDPSREAGSLAFDDSTEPLALVVDDEPAIRMLLERFLKGRGLRVETAADGGEALEILRVEQPSLMLLDLKMPGISGLQLLESMHAEGIKVPNIWAMSAYVPDEDALTALALGAGEFFNKPFDLDHLDFSLQLLNPLL